MADVLKDTLAKCDVVITKAGADTFFGEKGEVQVTILELTDALKALHSTILFALEAGGLVLNNKEFAYGEFLPHTTVQKHARLNKGDKVRITALSIVDMFPEGDPYRRRVLATVGVGG